MYHWKAGQPQLVGQPRVAGDLLAEGGHVAELEEVGDAPVARLQLGVALARLRAAAIMSAAVASRSSTRSGRHSATWRALSAEARAAPSPAPRAVATASALSASERVRSGA